MAAKAKASKGKPRRGAAKAKRASKPVKRALGNDPFERGAATRPVAAAPVAVVEADLEGVSTHAQPAANSTSNATPTSTSTQTLTSPSTAPPPSELSQSRGPAARQAEPVERSTPTSTPVSADEPLPSPATAAASLRERLDAVEERIQAELERVSEVAAAAGVRLGEAARAEANGEHARDVARMFAKLLPALREKLAALASLWRLFQGPGETDAFGMDRDLAERTAAVADFLYASWWRVGVRNIEAVPASGPAVVVANHGGALPWDGLVLRVALRRDHPARRDLRPLLDEHALSVPIAGGVATRLGAVAATPDHALRLLGAGTVVATFPEGSRTGQRPWPDRYRIQRFGRGGFVKLALRTGAPIVPCAIVGSEETAAPFTRPGWLAERLGIPALPGAALPLGPLGLVPLPSRWTLRFGDPIETASLGAAAASDAARVLELTERTRSALQDMLDEDVAARRTVYL
jgi:1-acyl-sn-glycerol-3-phosphate acyltransferase